MGSALGDSFFVKKFEVPLPNIIGKDLKRGLTVGNEVQGGFQSPMIF